MTISPAAHSRPALKASYAQGLAALGMSETAPRSGIRYTLIALAALGTDFVFTLAMHQFTPLPLWACAAISFVVTGVASLFRPRTLDLPERSIPLLAIASCKEPTRPLRRLRRARGRHCRAGTHPPARHASQHCVFRRRRGIILRHKLSRQPLLGVRTTAVIAG